MTNTFSTTGSSKITLLKDPDAVLDYTFDWTEWLNPVTDTLASHTVAVPTGVTLEQSEIVGKTVVAIISGGTVGQTYPITCHIVTAHAREDDRTFYLKIVER